jgi:hypothetical protein
MKRKGVTYDGETLTRETLPILVEYYGDDWESEDSGTPKFYLLDGGAIELVPKPSETSKTIGLKFWGYANDLSDSADVPFTTGDDDVGETLNSRLRSMDMMLVEYATEMAKYALGKYASINAALSNWHNKLDVKARLLNSSKDLEYTEKRIDPMHLRNVNGRLNRG